MAAYHTVVQGEHLSGIAKNYGFSSYKTIWDHAQNAELKKERQNPNLLNAKRRLRIANGSGVKVAEVNTLMNKFAQMQQMMKKFGKMQKMMGRMGGKMPGMR